MPGIIEESGIEEKYIISRLHTTIRQVTELMEAYRLDETIAPLELLYLDLSRNYVQMVREKSSTGTTEEKEAVLNTLAQVLLEFLKMFQIIAPFISEIIYLNFKEAFALKEASISHYAWPEVDKKKIKPELEQQVLIMQELLTAASAAREKAQLGLRWPVKEIIIETTQEEVSKTLNTKNIQELFLTRINAKNLGVTSRLPGVQVKVKPDYAKIGPAYGKLSPQIIAKLATVSSEKILDHVEKEGAYVFQLSRNENEINKNPIKIIREMLMIEREVPVQYKASDSKYGMVYVNTERTEALEAEGHIREVTRQIQQLRKDAGLEKRDRIELFMQASELMERWLEKFKGDMQEKVGAEKLEITTAITTPSKSYEHEKEIVVKKERLKVWLGKVR